MKLIGKIIFRMIGGSFAMLVLAFLGITFYMNTNPEFGGEATEQDIARYQQTGHYVGDHFENYHPINMEFSFDQFVKAMGEYFNDNPNNEPHHKIEIIKQDSLQLEQTKQQAKLIWFSHSAFLLQLDGKNILFDPMLTDVPAPSSFLAGSRYFKDLPIELEQLPQIDFVFISHDHYDHLDYKSIMALKEKTKAFILPMGVGVHLREWGVSENKIHEYNWWQEGSVNGLSFAFTPTRHFSGRGVLDRNHTLWGSWVVKGANKKIFFSGDGGYDDHFKKIGEQYGPFDIAMVECGQYNKQWEGIHMVPEESAQAIKDLKADVGIPIHWGGFSLSSHNWEEPPVRIKKKADVLGVKVVTPRIGEALYLDSLNVSYNPWWEEVNKEIAKK